MSSATLGAGALSLPHAFQSLGMLGGIGAIAAMAAAAHFSVTLLTSAIATTGARSYEQLTVQTFGGRMGLLVELNILVFCYGSLIAYTVAVGDLLEPLLQLEAVQERAPWMTRQIAMTLFWAVCMLPLSLVEKLSALQCSSLFGVISLIYLVLSVVVHAVLDALSSHHSGDLASMGMRIQGSRDGVRLFHFSLQSFDALAIIAFAFTMQVNIPSLYDELPRKSPARFGVVSSRCMCLCVVCYLLVGLAGYRDAPQSTHGNLLANYCVTNGSTEANIMLAAFGAMAASVVMAYPLNIHPCRYTLDVLLCAALGGQPPCGPFVRHVFWTVFLALSGLLIALYVPGINIVFQLMGSTSSAFVCFVLPAAFGLRLRVPRARSTAGRCGCWALLLGGATLGVVATCVTVSGLLSSDGDEAGGRSRSPCSKSLWHAGEAA